MSQVLKFRVIFLDGHSHKEKGEEIMSYIDEIKKKENIIFGIIWGLIAYFVGVIITNAIEIITKFINLIIEWSLWTFTLPAMLAVMLNIPYPAVVAGVTILIAIIMSPIVKKAFDWIVNMLTRK